MRATLPRKPNGSLDYSAVVDAALPATRRERPVPRRVDFAPPNPMPLPNTKPRGAWGRIDEDEAEAIWQAYQCRRRADPAATQKSIIDAMLEAGETTRSYSGVQRVIGRREHE